MNQPITGTVFGLQSQIDWETVMKQDRYAGGHEDVLQNIFGDKSTVLSWWSSEDYQGTVAIATRIPSGHVVIMTDYYGSCSGCDSWEGASDEDARKMIIDLVGGAKVFDSVEEAKEWCRSGIDTSKDPWNYPMEDARNLWHEPNNQ